MHLRPHRSFLAHRKHHFCLYRHKLCGFYKRSRSRKNDTFPSRMPGNYFLGNFAIPRTFFDRFVCNVLAMDLRWRPASRSFRVALLTLLLLLSDRARLNYSRSTTAIPSPSSVLDRFVRSLWNTDKYATAGTKRSTQLQRDSRRECIKGIVWH